MKSSNHMEKEGLCRALVFLAVNSMQVSMLITDRLSRLTNFFTRSTLKLNTGMMFGMFLRVSYLITHYTYSYTDFPLIGVKKKLAKLSQYKDCDIVGEWIKSITNHMYWCAASAPDGDGQQMVDRWKSVMSHLCDQHDDRYHLNTP